MPNATSAQQPAQSPSEMTARRLLAERDAWVREIEPSVHFHQVIDLLPGVYFFAKNRRGEAMFVSRSILERYGMTDEIEMLGKTDFDLNPENLARGYIADDAHVYATGEPIFDRVELWVDEQGIPDWHVVHKLPIRSRSGEVIGIMGIIQSYGDRERVTNQLIDLKPIIDNIKINLSGPIHIEDLAELGGFSVRQLERRFKAAFGIGPREYLIRTRLLAACRALRDSTSSVAKIAIDHGFCDQSSFAQQFKKHLGQSPTQFRRSSLRYWKHPTCHPLTTASGKGPTAIPSLTSGGDSS